MNNELIEKIAEGTYWRINIRPSLVLKKSLSLKECYDNVDRARVSMRGWDFPHISTSVGESGGDVRAGNYYGNWCNWSGFTEFWRMYKSGQFLSYKKLVDDWFDRKSDTNELPIHLVDAIYSITEYVEFASRLAKEGDYQGGVIIFVSLRNAKGRALEVGRGRMPFFNKKQTEAQSIDLIGEIPNRSDSEPVSIATKLIAEFFDNFGWNPELPQIRAEQDRLYKGLF